MTTKASFWVTLAGVAAATGCSSGNAEYCDAAGGCFADFGEIDGTHPEGAADAVPAAERRSTPGLAAPLPALDTPAKAEQATGDGARPAPHSELLNGDRRIAFESGPSPVGPAGAHFPDIAWSPALQQYVATMAVAHDRNDRSGDLFVSVLDRAGVPLVESRVTRNAAAVTTPRVAWGDGAFGVAWTETTDDATRVVFQRFSAADATPVGDPITVSPSEARAGAPDIAHVGGRGWFVTYMARAGSHPETGIFLARVASDGSIEPAEQVNQVLETGVLPRILAGETNVTVAWYTLDPIQSVRFRHLSSAYDKSVVHTLRSTGNPEAAARGAIYPQLARRGDDTAVAWTKVADDGGRRLFIDVYAPDGTQRCRSLGAHPVGVALAIAANEDGYSVAARGDGGAYLLRFGPDCTEIGLPRSFEPESGAALDAAELAESDGAPMLLWTERGASGSALTFSALLAD